LLDGQVLDWHSDGLLIEPLLEFLGVAGIYNDLVASVNAGQSGDAWSEEIQRHWHGQILGAHASLIGTKRSLLNVLSGKASKRVDNTPDKRTLAPIPGPADGWRVDPNHCRVGFTAKHMGIVTIRGYFSSVDIRLNLDETNPSHSSVEARIDARTVDTANELRDADLRSGSFLDAATFPWIVFVSTSVEATDPGRYRLTGDLTIHNVTRSVFLEMEASDQVPDGQGGRRRGFTLTGRICRGDFGLTWNVALETGAWLVSEEVRIEIDVEATGPAIVPALPLRARLGMAATSSNTASPTRVA
jgi:polyisoprenoid-binding protein YceI